MASNNSSIGNAAGLPIFSFTGPADTGPMMYYVSPPGVAPNNYSLIRACKEFTLQLGGNGTGLSVSLYFTTDRDTAAGVSANPIWSLCPAPSTEASAQWSNPMRNAEGQNAIQFKANAIALRAVAIADGIDPIAGTTELIMLASF